MTNDQIKHMVDRFLSWKLPDNFNPDGGVSFKAEFNENTPWPMRHEPSGTNLLDYTQAEAMVRHMLEGLPDAAEARTVGGMEPGAYTTLRAANIARQHEWTSGEGVDLVWRANELAGEVGEACNVVKKIARERRGWPGSRATLDELAAEIADVIICADLLAMTEGIDLDAAVAAKFNATSEKVGLRTRLAGKEARQ